MHLDINLDIPILENNNNFKTSSTNSTEHIWIVSAAFGEAGCTVLCSVTSLASDSMSPMDCSSPGSSVHGILQARIMEWVVVPFSRGSSQPRNQTDISSIILYCRQVLYPPSHLGSPEDWLLLFKSPWASYLSSHNLRFFHLWSGDVNSIQLVNPWRHWSECWAHSMSSDTWAVIIPHPLPYYAYKKGMGMGKATDIRFHAYFLITCFTTQKSSRYSILPLKWSAIRYRVSSKESKLHPSVYHSLEKELAHVGKNEHSLQHPGHATHGVWIPKYWVQHGPTFSADLSRDADNWKIITCSHTQKGSKMRK